MSERPRPSPVLTLLAVLLGGCWVSPPPAAVTSQVGMIRARTADEADHIGRLSEEIVDRMRERMPGLRVRSVDVWLLEEMTPYWGERYPSHIAGMTEYESGRIYLRRGDPDLEVHLAHELVHALLDNEWRILPGVVEEGLCDLIAAEVVDDGGRRHAVQRLVEASAFFGGFDVRLELADAEEPLLSTSHRIRIQFDGEVAISADDALKLDDEGVFDLATQSEGVGVYGLGFLVALAVTDRVGIQGLRRICERASAQGLGQVPSARLLREGGIIPTRSGYLKAVDRHLRAAMLPELAYVLRQGLAEASLEIAGGDGSYVDVEDFLARRKPRFGILGSRIRFPLWRFQPFRDVIEQIWNDQLP